MTQRINLDEGQKDWLIKRIEWLESDVSSDFPSTEDTHISQASREHSYLLSLERYERLILLRKLLYEV